MSRILLFLEHTENRRLLSEWLGMHYQVLLSDSGVRSGHSVPLLDEPFDLCILDGAALNHLWEWVQARKKAEQPVFLPFLLITLRPDVKTSAQHLWQSVDELVTKPIEKVELQARIEILLRSRQLSVQLKTVNEELQSEIAERQRVEAALAKSEAKFRAITPFKASLANPGETQISQYRFQHKDGSWRYLESKSNFSPTNVSLNGIVVNSRDISQRQQAEEDIISALKKEREITELKSRFFSMVAHEIRNPLNTILAAAQILERYGEQWSEEKKKDFFDRIKTSVKLLTELLDDVLIIGKAEANKLEFKPVALNLKKFINDLLEEIKLTTNEHTIVFATQCQCINVYLDEKLLRHIFSNLLLNAIKYSPKGSTINFDLICQNDLAIFQIKDEGIGIPPEDQNLLFEAFHRATNVKNIPGTGLGLAIVKRCVDLYSGAIAVKSEVGVGTTFTVTLPLRNGVG